MGLQRQELYRQNSVFMPVENLLPSLPPPRVGGGVHTLWTVLWTAFDTGSARRKRLTPLGFTSCEAHISV